MPRRDVGIFSRAMTDSLRMAEVLQAQAVLGIREAYGVEDRKMMDIEGLTWEKFNEILDNADRTGKREELENELRGLMAEALISIMSQPQQPQQGAPPQ